MHGRIVNLTFGVAIAALVLLGGSAGATVKYVAPDGSGDGSSWPAATNSIQGAIDVCTSDGDVIYLKYGGYSNTSAVVVSNLPGLTIKGGYTGIGFELTNAPSVITRDAAVNMRLVDGYTSTVTLERVTISGGYLVNSSAAAGMYMRTCTLVLSNCVVRDNQVRVSSTGVNGYGAGLRLDSCTTTIRNTMLTNNWFYLTGARQTYRGGCIYASGGTLAVFDSAFRYNRQYRTSGYTGILCGGALYGNAMSLTCSNTVFDANASMNSRYYGSGSTLQGGAMYLVSSSAEFLDCTFTTNACVGLKDNCYGGTLYGKSMSTLTMKDCTVVGSYAAGPRTQLGGILYMTGGAPVLTLLNTRFLNCIGSYALARDLPDSVGDIYMPATGTLNMRNCELNGNAGYGIYSAGATLRVTNCLVAACGSDGVRVTAGAVALVNCTFAGNVGWGVNDSGAGAMVSNSIAWGNVGGGMTLTGGTVAYTHSQETHAGTDNSTADPLLVYGHYLSVDGLQGQTADSPCIDAGAGTAASMGLTDKTTRTDNSDDTGDLDLGFHYAGGMAAAEMSNIVLYVDAVNGTNTNDGLTPSTALKTISAALAQAIHGSTINIATGLYGTALGEGFPLTIQDADLTLRGTNRADTVIRGDGTANRVMTCLNKGGVRLAGLTLESGYYSGHGGGAYFDNCAIMLTNCVIKNNRAYWPDSTTRRGGGLYLSSCRTTIRDCVFSNNRVHGPGRSSTTDYSGAGGSIYAVGGTLDMADASVMDCFMYATSPYAVFLYGGGIFTMAMPTILSNVVFRGNYTNPSGNSGSKSYGGAIYLGGTAARVVDCTFSNNYSYAPSDRRGGAIYVVTGAGSAVIDSCMIVGNGTAVSSPGDVYVISGNVGMTNCLIATNWTSGIICAGGVVSVVNGTLAANTAWGLTSSAGTVDVKNTIAWGNALGGIANATVSYSCSQEAHVGDGNISVDPLFVDSAARDYHVQSRVGAWHNDVQDWVKDDEQSLCIDAGDKSSAWSRETQPNRGRVNMGAYGNTLYASKTLSVGTVFLIR